MAIHNKTYYQKIIDDEEWEYTNALELLEKYNNGITNDAVNGTDILCDYFSILESYMGRLEEILGMSGVRFCYDDNAVDRMYEACCEFVEKTHVCLTSEDGKYVIYIQVEFGGNRGINSLNAAPHRINDNGNVQIYEADTGIWRKLDPRLLSILAPADQAEAYDLLKAFEDAVNYPVTYWDPDIVMALLKKYEPMLALYRALQPFPAFRVITRTDLDIDLNSEDEETEYILCLTAKSDPGFRHAFVNQDGGEFVIRELLPDDLSMSAKIICAEGSAEKTEGELLDLWERQASSESDADDKDDVLKEEWTSTDAEEALKTLPEAYDSVSDDFKDCLIGTLKLIEGDVRYNIKRDFGLPEDLVFHYDPEDLPRLCAVIADEMGNTYVCMNAQDKDVKYVLYMACVYDEGEQNPRIFVLHRMGKDGRVMVRIKHKMSGFEQGWQEVDPDILNMIRENGAEYALMRAVEEATGQCLTIMDKDGIDRTIEENEKILEVYQHLNNAEGHIVKFIADAGDIDDTTEMDYSEIQESVRICLVPDDDRRYGALIMKMGEVLYLEQYLTDVDLSIIVSPEDRDIYIDIQKRLTVEKKLPTAYYEKEVYTTSSAEDMSHTLQAMWGRPIKGNMPVFTIPISGRAYDETYGGGDGCPTFWTDNEKHEYTPEEMTNDDDLIHVLEAAQDWFVE